MRGAYARNTDPQSSHEAASQVNVNAYEHVVLSALRAYGDMIQTEVVAITGYPNETITPRFASLERKGLIRKTGEKRKGRSGVRCNVYTLVEEVA